MRDDDVTKDGDLDAVRAEYAVLLGITRRTPDQEARYAVLSDMLEKWPPPFMTPDQQKRHRETSERLDAAMLAMTDGERERMLTSMFRLGQA